MTTTMRIVRAEPTQENLAAVLGLIGEASAWLREKDTDQWAMPWPDRERRDARVLKGLEVGKTWIVWDKDRPAATVTIATGANLDVWSRSARDYDLSEPAVYVHRLITARDYAGWGLGAELIDWAGLRGRRDYQAEWIRIDVWTSNAGLHDFYRKRGFERCGTCANPDYPSGALFQKRVSLINAPSVPQFTEFPARPESFSDLGPATLAATRS